MTYAAGPQMYRTRRQVRRWSVGHHAPSQSRVVASPGPSPHTGRVGALTEPQHHSNRANDSGVGSAPNVPPDSAIGVVKIALPSLTDRRVGSLT
jgi:hypothetical protein